jgi:hypothetical protein
VPLSEALRQRRETIVIDDLTTYRRCRVQQWGLGAVLRDEVQGAAIKTKVQQVCRADQLLVAEIDAKVGGFAIVPPELTGAVVSGHYFLFDIDSSILEPGFLGWYLRSGRFQNQVVAQGTTNYAAIRATDVLRYRIPLPQVGEQREIASTLTALDARVGAARKHSLTVRDELRSLVPSAVRRARQGLAPIETLGSVADILDARRIPVNASERAGRAGSIPYYGAGGRVGWIDRALFDEPLLLIAEDAGPFDGRCGYLIDGPSWVNNHAHVLRGGTASNEWILWMLRTTDLGPYLSGSTRPKLTLGALSRIPIPVPSRETQAALLETWRAIGASAEEALSRSAATAQDLDGLVPAALANVLTSTRGQAEVAPH